MVAAIPDRKHAGYIQKTYVTAGDKYMVKHTYPFNAKYVLVLEQTAKENDIQFHAIHIESSEEAQNAPTPITNYAMFHDGKYITNEQMNDKKFLRLVNG